MHCDPERQVAIRPNLRDRDRRGSALLAEQVEPLACLMAGEHLVGAVAEMHPNELAKHVSEIGGDGEVPLFEQLLRLESRPIAVHAASAHRSPQHHHHVAVAVIGAGVAVFSDGAAELRHGDEHDLVHPVAHVEDEGRQRRAEFIEQR